MEEELKAEIRGHDMMREHEEDTNRELEKISKIEGKINLHYEEEKEMEEEYKTLNAHIQREQDDLIRHMHKQTAFVTSNARFRQMLLTSHHHKKLKLHHLQQVLLQLTAKIRDRYSLQQRNRETSEMMERDIFSLRKVIRRTQGDSVDTYKKITEMQGRISELKSLIEDKYVNNKQELINKRESLTQEQKDLEEQIELVAPSIKDKELLISHNLIQIKLTDPHLFQSSLKIKQEEDQDPTDYQKICNVTSRLRTNILSKADLSMKDALKTFISKKKEVTKFLPHKFKLHKVMKEWKYWAKMRRYIRLNEGVENKLRGGKLDVKYITPDMKRIRSTYALFLEDQSQSPYSNLFSFGEDTNVNQNVSPSFGPTNPKLDQLEELKENSNITNITNIPSTITNTDTKEPFSKGKEQRKSEYEVKREMGSHSPTYPRPTAKVLEEQPKEENIEANASHRNHYVEGRKEGKHASKTGKRGRKTKKQNFSLFN